MVDRDRVAFASGIVQINVETFGIRQLYIAHPHLPKLRFLDPVNDSSVGPLRIMSNVSLQAHIAVYQIRDRNFTSSIVDAISKVPLDRGFLLPKIF